MKEFLHTSSVEFRKIHVLKEENIDVHCYYIYYLFFQAPRIEEHLPQIEILIIDDIEENKAITKREGECKVSTNVHVVQLQC